MAEAFTPFDPTSVLQTDADFAVFIADALETNHASYIAKAVGSIVQVKGIAQIAEETGFSQEQLYRSFSEHGNPTLKSTLAVIKALGLQLTVKMQPEARV